MIHFLDDPTNGYGTAGDPNKWSDSEDESCGEAVKLRCRRGAKQACTKKQLYKRVPILDWLPDYDRNKAVSDLIAGITVGLTVIPQGIAYALVAELPPKVLMNDAS